MAHILNMVGLDNENMLVRENREPFTGSIFYGLGYLRIEEIFKYTQTEGLSIS